MKTSRDFKIFNSSSETPIISSVVVQGPSLSLITGNSAITSVNMPRPIHNLDLSVIDPPPFPLSYTFDYNCI